MPAHRQLPRRSARLQALACRSILMAARGRTAQKMSATNALQVPPTRGGVPAPQKKKRGRGAKTTTTPAPAAHQAAPPAPSVPAPAKKTPAANITWEGRRSDLLVEWITSHAADRHILFHDSRSSTHSTPKLSPDDKPSGKNKKDVSAAIARHIFEKDPDHSTSYTEDPSRYVTSVINRLSTLKTKYREHRSRFKSTGSGISPEAEEGDAPPQNLLEDVLRVFPYYQALDAIWNGIPSFDSELVSSKPNANHAESLLGIIQPKSAASSKSTMAFDEEDLLDTAMPDEDDAPAGPSPAPVENTEDVYAQGDEQVEMDYNADFDDGETPAMEDMVPSHQQEPEARHPPSQAQPSREFTPFSIKSKGKMPLRDGRNSFLRHSPYPRSPSSTPSMMSGVSHATTSTKRAASLGSANPFKTKLAELDRVSEMLVDEGSVSAPSSKALRYTFAIRKQELDNQREELSYRRTDSEMEFKREEQLRKLEIQLSQEETHKISQQIKLLELQLELQRQMQFGALPPSATGFPSSSSAAGFPSSSSAAGFPSSSSAAGSLSSSSAAGSLSSLSAARHASSSSATGFLSSAPSGLLSSATGPPFSTSSSASGSFPSASFSPNQFSAAD